MGAVRQHAQRDMPEPLLIVQEIRQSVVADLVDIFAMHLANYSQVTGINNDLAADGNGRLHL